MNTLPLWQAATGLLAIAFASGLVMAGYRFGSDRESPVWLAKLHGYAAVAALALLLFSAAQATLSSVGLLGVLALLLAAAGGVVLNLGYHWRHKPLPEGLVFAHMAVAFVGFILVFLRMLAGSGHAGA